MKGWRDVWYALEGCPLDVVILLEHRYVLSHCDLDEQRVTYYGVHGMAHAASVVLAAFSTPSKGQRD